MQTKPSSYDSAVVRAFRAALDQALAAPTSEQIEAACQKLRSATPQRRKLLLLNSPHMRRFEVAARLAQEAFALRGQDPNRMFALAELAVEVAEAVDPGSAELGLVQDTRARAWGYLANAQRVLNRYPEAGSSWREADDYRAAGTGDPMLEAELLGLRADLLIDQLHCEPAIELLRQSSLIYRQIGEGHLLGRSFVLLGRAYAEAERQSEAIQAYYQALRYIEAGQEKDLALITLINLAKALTRAGEVETAMAVLAQVSPLYDAAPDSDIVLKTRWVYADLLHQVGRRQEACTAYAAVRTSYVRLGRDRQAASVCLEEAIVLAELGRWEAVATLAAEMYPIFLSKEIEEEAAATLALFSAAVERRTASVEMLREFQQAFETALG